MADLGQTAVALRIVGDDLDPDEVTRLLGVNPTGSARKGDMQPDGKVAAPTGSWRLESTAFGDLDSKIAEILARLPGDLSVWSALSRRYRCDIFCGLFMHHVNEGAELAPDTLALLGKRRLHLGLDLYASLD